MVHESIVPGHRISTRGIEVDKANIEAIEKLPPPSSVKGIRSFLGHAVFYRRFIKDFSWIAKPLSSFLVQGTPIDFDEQCVEHFGGQPTAAKVLQSGFYWQSFFKDAHKFVSTCDKCQRMGGISKQDEPLMRTILEVELFNLWGMDFMGPIPSSFSNLYILLAMDYVSKWVDAIPTCTTSPSQPFIYTVRHSPSINHRWWYSFLQQSG